MIGSESLGMSWLEVSEVQRYIYIVFYVVESSYITIAI